MDWDIVVRIAPLIGGAALLIICMVNILRNEGISNANAAVLVLAGILFTVPYFPSIAVKTPIFEWKAEAASKVAELKGELTRLQEGIDTLLKKSGAPVTAPTENGVVLIFYAPDKRNLAREMEKALLRKGFNADAVMTDFTELTEDRRGAAGTAQINFVDSSEARAKKVRSELQPQFPILNNAGFQPAKLRRGDVDIRLF